LFSLKQALRAWNKKIYSFLLQKGFIKCVNKYGIYYRNTTNKLIVCLYVDDIIITGSNEAEMELMVDSKSSIDLAKHLVAHGRSKHIETKFHFLRD